MRGLHDLDPPARRAVAIAGDDQAREGAVPRLLHDPGHGRTGLAGTDHDGTPARPRRQVGGQADGRRGAADGRLEQREQTAGRRVH